MENAGDEERSFAEASGAHKARGALDAGARRLGRDEAGGRVLSAFLGREQVSCMFYLG